LRAARSAVLVRAAAFPAGFFLPAAAPDRPADRAPEAVFAWPAAFLRVVLLVFLLAIGLLLRRGFARTRRFVPSERRAVAA